MRVRMTHIHKAKNMNLIFRLVFSALAIFITVYILPGVHVTGLETYFVLAVVLGVINMFLKPVLVLLTLPLSIVTLGLFSLVLNTLLILLAEYIVPGFSVDGFWWALIFGLVLSLVSSVLTKGDN